MNDLIRQLALIDNLLANWDGIRLRMEPVTAPLQAALDALAVRLAAARGPDDLARVIDDLIDLALDTPAEAFVRALVASAQLQPLRGHARDEVAVAIPDPLLEQRAAAGLQRAGARAGAALTQAVEPVVVPVFFATNRAAADGDLLGFLGRPGGAGAPNTYGLAQVTIPVAVHRPGVVERPRWWTLFPSRNPEQRFVVIREMNRLAAEAFASALEQAVAAQSGGDLLVFVHGYHVTFEDAARRAAQLAHDLDFRGAIVLFSWPSAGDYLSYNADAERAVDSADALSGLLAVLSGGPWRRVHVIAHSMGNRVATLCLGQSRSDSLTFGELVLAAADVNVEMFARHFPVITQRMGGRITSYASRMDLPLLISRAFNRIDRVGFIEETPFVIDGMETIDASGVDTDVVGHSYFAQESTLLRDLRVLFAQGKRAGERAPLERTDGARWWHFPPASTSP